MVGNVYHQAILSLRKPSGTNNQFRRLAYALFNVPNASAVLHYMGDDTTAVQFPH